MFLLRSSSIPINPLQPSSIPINPPSIKKENFVFMEELLWFQEENKLRIDFHLENV